MQDPKTERPVRQPEVPHKNGPVQEQPANDRPVEGEAISQDELAQGQPAVHKRVLQNK